MSQCQRCHVTIDESMSHCPVCGRFIQKSDPTKLQTVYPDPNYRRILRQQTKKIESFFAFPLLLALLITFIIDLALISSELGTTFLMTFIILYAWTTLYHTVFSQHNLSTRILWQFIVISFGLITLNFVSTMSFNTWPLQYVVPLMLMTINLFLFVLGSIRRHAEILLFHMFLFSFMGLGQYAIAILFLDITIPSILTGMSSILSLTALVTYLRKPLLSFIHRWFHI
jgi:rRNA maturation protein Nop10